MKKFTLKSVLLGLSILLVTFQSFGQSSGTTNDTFTVNSNDNGPYGEVKLMSGSGSYADWHLRSIFGDLNFSSNNNSAFDTRMTIRSNGNVGIGTNNPSEKFHVNGNAQIDGRLEARGAIELWPNSPQNLDIRMDSHTWMKWNIQNGPNNSDFIGRFHFFSDNYSVVSARGIATFEGYRGIILGEWSSPSLYVKRDPTNPSAIGPVAIGTRNFVDGARLTVDGRVYISEEGGTEEGFDDATHDNYKDFLLWVEEGIVSNDYALSSIDQWPDYVFSAAYSLSSMESIEDYIRENGHLPTMPSAAEIETNGFTVSDMTKRMVKTIEEMTLHTIDQEKKITDLTDRLAKLEAYINK